jgi:undecaprenyl diphosphate synthase
MYTPAQTRAYQPSGRLHELSAEERAVFDQLCRERMPRHVAIIMDGNGRWAGKRALKRFLGHQQGAERVQNVVETATRIDLEWITLYALSIENRLRRPATELSFLMQLLKTFLVGNVNRMNDNNVRLAYIGRTHLLPADIQETMAWAADRTAKNTGTTLTLALNYGARAEIVDAARTLVRNLLLEARQRTCGTSIEDLLAVEGEEHALDTRIDEAPMSAALYTAGVPDPDLLIRTSGEQRISNYLLWQIAYAEIVMTERLWPDFRGVDLLEAIAEYQQRERRFGGLGEATDEDLSAVLPTTAQKA